MNQEIEILEQETVKVLGKAKLFNLIDQSGYEKAGKFLLRVKCLIKEIKMTFDPIVRKTNEAHKEATTQRNFHLNPVVEAETILKQKCKGYEREMEAKAEVERKKAEKERQDKIDEENKKRREKAEQEAKDEAEVMGVDAAEVEVDEIEEATAEDVDVEQPLPVIDRVKGLGIRRNWKTKIIDIDKVPRDFLLPDMVTLNRIARESKGKKRIPGVEFYED